MKIRLLMVVVIAMALGACTTQQTVNKLLFKNVDYNVRLDPKPNATPPHVNILSKPQGANSNGRKNGFVGYARGEQGYTVFSIKNEDPADNCATGASWVITKLRLATQGDASTEKGSNFGARQDDWLEDAFPGADRNGVFFPKPRGPQEVTELKVFNANGTKGEVDVFYEVTLMDCSDPDETLTTDPMWRNEGR